MSDLPESTPIPNEVEVEEADKPNEKPGSSKKKTRTSPDRKVVSLYNRKLIMNHLKDNGSDPKSCANAIKHTKISSEEAAKFVNEKTKAAQDHVHEECNSVCYKNINSWLEYYKSKNFNHEAKYESALIMLAIADMAHHPNPKDNGGVDFQKIYRFLGDVMLGNPTPELNTESKEYLGQEFESLINMANTRQGDADTKKLHEIIEKKTGQIIPQPTPAEKKKRREFGSLDPMGLDNFISATEADKN
ncbi:uncharacterized protein LOC129946064 [Eupeodes corollae]|uniref:uncharacterized protein LOC129946064 n=1 Tax=Eupeodes corollae TaxID=290404 RepID=UPI0024917001|nr:uncharacterized protein LOC129946064 [Eupeodes corollae]